MGHAGLVAHEGRQVARLLRVVGRERLDLAAVSGGTLARQEAQRTVAVIESSSGQLLLDLLSSLDLKLTEGARTCSATSCTGSPSALNARRWLSKRMKVLTLVLVSKLSVRRRRRCRPCRKSKIQAPTRTPIQMITPSQHFQLCRSHWSVPPWTM